MSDTGTVQPWAWEFNGDEQTAWADATAERISVDRTARVISANGACHRCGHDLNVYLTDRQILPPEPAATKRGALAVAEHAWDQPVIRFELWCACTGDHPARPGELDRGCGAHAVFRDE